MTKRKAIIYGVAAVGVAGLGLMALGNIGSKNETTPVAPAEPVTAELAPGYYRAVAGAIVFGTSPSQIMDIFRERTCVEVLENYPGYAYTKMRYAAGTPTGYASGGMLKGDLQPDPACALLRDTFARGATTAPTATTQTGYPLFTAAPVFANRNANASEAIAQLPAGTCVKPADAANNTLLQQITVRVGNRTITGWGVFYYNTARSCNPGL